MHQIKTNQSRIISINQSRFLCVQIHLNTSIKICIFIYIYSPYYSCCCWIPPSFYLQPRLAGHPAPRGGPCWPKRVVSDGDLDGLCHSYGIIRDFGWDYTFEISWNVWVYVESLPWSFDVVTGVGKCANWTSPNYWGYNLQQIFEGDVQNPKKGTFTDPCIRWDYSWDGIWDFIKGLEFM